MEEKEYSSPKLIEFFETLNRKVVSIFAGGNCSFAVDQTGILYAWGDVKSIIMHKYFYEKNANGMLGMTGDGMVFEPQMMDGTPWSSNIGTQVIFGKNSRGHIFQCISHCFSNFRSLSWKTKVILDLD